MYKGKKILAIIPARGGSKGVYKKNIRKIIGVPLIAIAHKCAKKVKEIDKVILSTDDETISKVGLKYDINIPFKRPKKISKDKSSDWEVMCHGLKKIEKIEGKIYDIVMLLQPTAPLRKAKDLKKVIQLIVDNKFDAVWTVSETDLKYHPRKQLQINNGLISYIIKSGEKLPTRQELEPIYHVNGVAYALTRECVLKQKKRLGKKTGAYLINGPSLSIDTDEDFKIANKILKKI